MQADKEPQKKNIQLGFVRKLRDKSSNRSHCIFLIPSFRIPTMSLSEPRTFILLCLFFGIANTLQAIQKIYIIPD